MKSLALPLQILDADIIACSYCRRTDLFILTLTILKLVKEAFSEALRIT